MFKNIRLRGTKGEVLWGYRTAASVRSWTIARRENVKKENKPIWQLFAQLERVDAFQLRQSPLLFTAPNGHGQWCFPLLDVQVKDGRLYAQLGPPEQ